MATLKINSSIIIDEIRPMHGVNNGPAHPPESVGGNFKAFEKLKIPYVRNHDASLSEAYGSQHVVDIHCIFTDFSKDVNDESAYDFALTDVYVKNILSVGSKVFYRLGSSIEHWAKKFGTVVPSDFGKWAQICEHIIMHYNEGWANGYNYNIEYWEIWNEADLDDDDALDKRTWGGTKKQFFEFYNIVANYLKDRFPSIKIGGPALAGRLQWADEFLAQLKAPLDFFSYHRYTYEPGFIVDVGIEVKRLLEKHGFDRAERILNEWNYVKDWSDPIEYIKTIKSVKGAAFSAAVMCAAQNCKVIDMLMYYDARITKMWNGLFDSDTLEPLKGYYPFLMFSELYEMKNQILCECDDKDLYVLGASKNENGCKKSAIMLSYYTTDDNAKEKNVTIDSEANRSYEYLLLDKEKNFESVSVISGKTEITVKPNTVIYLREKDSAV